MLVDLPQLGYSTIDDLGVVPRPDMNHVDISLGER